MRSIERIPLSVLLLLAGELVFSDSSVGAAEKVARLVYPNGVAIAEGGGLIISDIGSHTIYRCDAEGRLSVIAGTGKAGFAGDNGPAAEARLNAPFDVLVRPSDGAILFADTYNHRIRCIDRDGRITTIAGNGKSKYAGDGGSATEASLQLPQAIALDSHGHLYIADTFNHVVRRVDSNGIIATCAGSEPGLAGDGGPATKAQLNTPLAVALDGQDQLYICDSSNSRIRRVASDGTIKTLMGSGEGAGKGGAGFDGDGGPPARAKLFTASDLKFDRDGNWFISDSGNNCIRTVRENVVATLAGTGDAGFAGDGGAAKQAQLKAPQKLAITKDGIVYFADRANHRIRKNDLDGKISTFAGDGAPDVAIQVAGNR